MIELCQVAVAKSGKKRFQHFNWKIEKGENWVLQGPNGSGKTLLLELLAGVIHPSEGEIKYDFVTGETWEQRYEQRKQAVHYIPSSSVLSQINPHELFYQQRYYSFGDEFVPQVKDLLGEQLVRQIDEFNFPPSLSIHHLLDLKLTRLSNGQSKKLMLLKTLAQQMPKVLLLDYPFEALDRQSRKDLAAFLDFISTQFSVQIVLTDHDTQLPAVMNRKLVLNDFQMVSQGEMTPAPYPESADAKGRNDSLSPSQPVVEMKEVSIQYADTTIVKKLNWTINKGERWALAGRNGSGKTTLFSLIFADHPIAYSQQVFLFGKRRGTGESIWEIKNRITYLGPEQMSYLDPKDTSLSGREYLAAAKKNPDPERLVHLIDYFEATSFIDQPLRQLSSGQLQLVLIMQSFLFQKELLLLDEPFRFLDRSNKEKVNQYLQNHLNTETTLVLITHDEEDMKRWAQRVLWL